jgi:hypothetical protein
LQILAQTKLPCLAAPYTHCAWKDPPTVRKFAAVTQIGAGHAVANTGEGGMQKSAEPVPGTGVSRFAAISGTKKASEWFRPPLL